MIQPTTTPKTAFGSKIPARMPTNRAPSFGKATVSTVTKPGQIFSLGDPFSSAASGQSGAGGLFSERRVRGKSTSRHCSEVITNLLLGRDGTVVTPELAPGFAAMQLEGGKF